MMLRNMARSVLSFVPVKLSVKIVIVKLDCHVNLLQPAFLPKSHCNTHAFLRRFVHILSGDLAVHASQLQAQILAGGCSTTLVCAVKAFRR